MTRCRLGLVLAMLWLGPGAAWAEPPRTITLAPHLTELVYAVGGEAALVGVVAWSDYPSAAQQLPHIGDAFRLDLERIVALQAEQALAWTGGTPPEAARRLEQLGLTVHWIETRNLNQIGGALRQIGSALGMTAVAEDAAAAFDTALQDRRQHRPAVNDLSVFYQVSAQPLFTLGGQHVINEVFELCGAHNVFADLNTEASAVDREAVLARSPDVILIGSNGDSHDASSVQSDPILVEQATVIVINADFLVRPTPRLLQGINELCIQLQGLRDATD